MDVHTSSIVRFGVYELDPRAGELRRGGRRVALQPQPLEILLALLERPGEVVTREELRRRLWSNGAYVDFDRSLNKAMVKLRDALGDEADSPRYIETLPRHGYRFIPIAQAQTRVDPASGGPSPPEAASLGAPGSGPGKAARRRSGWWIAIAAAFASLALVVLAQRLNSLRSGVTSPAEYVALTDVTDSATAPALSPDGRMLAFIRGGSPFLSSGQIWLKLLPDGEPVQLTHSAVPIFAPTFTPDGTHVAYTAATGDWDTWIVPVAGGEPARLLANASGLAYIGHNEVMYSAVKTGIHLGLVTSLDDRSEYREIYLPEHERGMAHYSSLSPDRKSVLVVEMNGAGNFQRCRLVPFTGGAPGELVGPEGSCRSAAWSPDAKWMYFAANVAGRSHLWRQRDPHGVPEQITFGPSEEETVTVSPDGRALLTSVGSEQSSLWLHDRSGERALTTESYASQPWLSADGRWLYFLVVSAASGAMDLQRLSIPSGRKEFVLTGLPRSGFGIYDISADERQVAFTKQRDGVSEIWIAPLDRHEAPRLLVRGGDTPKFDRYGRVWFRRVGAHANFLHRVNLDDGAELRVLDTPILSFQAVAPAGDSVVAFLPLARRREVGTWLLPVSGGAPYLLSGDWTTARWSPNGKLLYVGAGRFGQTDALRIANLPAAPGPSVGPPDATAVLHIDRDGLPSGPPTPVEVIPHFENQIAVGPDPSVYVYVKVEPRRNIYRIPLH